MAASSTQSWLAVMECSSKQCPQTVGCDMQELGCPQLPQVLMAASGAMASHTSWLILVVWSW